LSLTTPPTTLQCAITGVGAILTTAACTVTTAATAGVLVGVGTTPTTTTAGVIPTPTTVGVGEDGIRHTTIIRTTIITIRITTLTTTHTIVPLRRVT
jgi:hypothetical protein